MADVIAVVLIRVCESCCGFVLGFRRKCVSFGGMCAVGSMHTVCARVGFLVALTFLGA